MAKTKKGEKMSALKAGAIGAIGGAIAGAAAVALSDEKTRKKIGQKLEELEGKAVKMVGEAEDKVKKLESSAKKEVAKRVAGKGK